ncbi:ftsX-like permease family protein [[Clostridium] bifermentans ATCC 638]|uniref:FtsX-like permease family protein n=2 Tax=Paraclostridium bifermentans TaxID=1490 RepID=T4VQ96_PARBF|nr:ABC transporter permease [Paraclostridium bifermentans]EQK42857.1 ftsX-like permease family protein [[Clostridium] bifermentans ATCC 638] [Paraclostridium bifermentans ATCC 638 = DSM 14991]UAG16743.1 ABC transporter permease [Paraclostridium bifermentans]
MYFKLALENVRKSFKVYRIYFLTLALAVSIFYSFNSIESQHAMYDLNKSAQSYIDVLIQSIEIISVFVSFILGSLILYANNFLIKKRKKELGIYRTLGMGNFKISQVLVIETAIVGSISLVVGLLIGLVLSQGLSAFTSQLFEVDMSKYKFIISTKSIQKTIVYFGIIFSIVMVFNFISIARYKIIDLINAGKKVENLKFRNPIIYILTFSLSVYLLLTSYKLILKVGIMGFTNYMFLKVIGFGILGTFLFFYSLSGVFILVIAKNKKIYFKGLNIFTIKQLNSKINTNFLSISIISLMIFLTIGILSTGISFKNVLEKSLRNSTPFDASVYKFIDKDEKTKTVEDSLNALNFKFDDTEKYIYFTIYDSGIKLKNLIDKKYVKNKNTINENFNFAKLELMKISDYNNIRKLEGKKAIHINPNEVILTSNRSEYLNIFKDAFRKTKKINLYGKDYNIKNGEIYEETFKSSEFLDNTSTLIVNDSLVESAKPVSSNLNVEFTGDYNKSEKKFESLLDSFKEGKLSYDKVGFLNGNTKQAIYANQRNIITIIIFIGMYLGIIFLISSMAILAVQQLSEASDSIERYKSLMRLGVNEKMINKAIFIQTLIYFALPISLAFIHSIVGIKVVSDFISLLDKPNIKYSSISTAIILIIVYISYFYTTYIGYKNIVKNSK